MVPAWIAVLLGALMPAMDSPLWVYVLAVMLVDVRLVECFSRLLGPPDLSKTTIVHSAVRGGGPGLLGN